MMQGEERGLYQEVKFQPSKNRLIQEQGKIPETSQQRALHGPLGRPISQKHLAEMIIVSQ